MSCGAKRIFGCLPILFILFSCSAENPSEMIPDGDSVRDNIPEASSDGGSANKPISETNFVGASIYEFTNPINVAGADPYVMLHTDGYYYYTRTLGDRLDIWKSRTLTGIDLGERKTIWTASSGLRDIWAPEIHHINEKWYLYYTGNTGCGDACRGIYVLENVSDDPLHGEWVEKGKVNTQYAGLDGSVFEHHGQLYFTYAAYGEWSGSHGSGIAIASMSNPWTLNGDDVIVTYPEYEWEQKGMHVNEGSVILKRNNHLFLVYSGSACWEDDYAIGMLSTSVDSDLLDPNSWTKSTKPVFSTSVKNGVYGPGHNSFVRSKDGTEDWIVYHGNSEPGQGCGLRPTRLQKLVWNEDDTPDFGIPTNGPLQVPSAEYRIEAEHGIWHEAQLNDKKDSSNHKTVTLANENSYLLIEDINVPESGIYQMIVKYSSSEGSLDATGSVSVNGEVSSVLIYPHTEKGEFNEATMQVKLNRGRYNSIKFIKDNHIVEIDYIEFTHIVE